jgi:outer membrane biosynthesis protein TonB
MFLLETAASALALFADEEIKPYPFVIQGLWIAGALLVAAVIIALANKWRKSGGNARLSASDQLGHFRELFEEGVIDQEEYDSLRRVLGGELRRTAKPKPAAAETATGPAIPTEATQAMEKVPEKAPEPATPPSEAPKPEEPPAAEGIRPA